MMKPSIQSPETQFVTIKSAAEIEKMRAAGRLAARALNHAAAAVRPGITTGELDRIAADFIRSHGAIAASLGYKGFPRSICTSVDDVVCHGIPSDNEMLKEGSIINLDVAVVLDGFYGDNSVTVGVGDVSPSMSKLMSVAHGALHRAIKHVRPGLRTREIGTVIEDHIMPHGFTSVREFVGPGLGRSYHEPPSIFHYRNQEPSIRLRPGMCFTIEPMINEGSADVLIEDDGWTVRTRDRKRSAQFEHSLLVTEDGCEILTQLPPYQDNS